jgi:hypothetical protein
MRFFSDVREILFPRKKGEKMVCAKCEVKLKRVITPDPWAQRVAAAAKGGEVVGASSASSSAPRVLLNENKALTSSKNYILGSQSCSICKKSLHQPGLFCQPCAFQQGKCAMCGVEVQDVSMHNVGGDLERKLRDKSMREKSEKLAKLEKLEEERDNLEEEKRRKKRKKEEKKEEEKEGKEEKDDEEEGEKKKKKTIATASPAVVAKIEPTGATNLVGSLLQQSAGASLATASNAPTWQYDSKSGYYFDASKMQYYDPKTKLYFCCKTNKWLKPENEKPKNGTFKSGTRKPDKFGL